MAATNSVFSEYSSPKEMCTNTLIFGESCRIFPWIDDHSHRYLLQRIPEGARFPLIVSCFSIGSPSPFVSIASSEGILKRSMFCLI